MKSSQYAKLPVTLKSNKTPKARTCALPPVRTLEKLDQFQLLDLARDYPWFMFTGEQIACLCNVSQDVVSKVKNSKDSPFFLNKCRPEWFLEWMRSHPQFQLSKEAFSCAD